MSLERLLALVTAAFVSICLGVALLLLAPGGANKDAPETAQTQPSEAPQEPQAQEPQTPPPAEAPPPAAATEAPAPAAAEASEARKKIEAALAAAPEYARFFSRLRDAFPSDYEATMDGFAARFGAAGKLENVDFYLSEAVRNLRQKRGVGAAKAETAPLGRVFDMQLEVLKAVAKEDKRLCVAFLYGATDADFQRFAGRRRGLVANMALAGLEAMANGEEKKIERPAPSEADFKVLETALANKGLGKVEIDALLDGKTPEPPLDDAVMCAAGQTYLETMRTLPEPVRLRIYGLAVELMARS